MKFQQLRILTDENLPPKVVDFLRHHGLDVLDTREQGWHGKSDSELLEIAYRNNRWILTLDSDFGTLAIHEAEPYIGIIFLRLRNQRAHNIIRLCELLLHHDMDFLPQTLVVVADAGIRTRRSDGD